MAQDPKLIGVDPKTPDDVLENYKKGIAARAQAQRAARPGLPNLAQANEQYKPGKDRPMTLGQMGEAQRAVEPPKGTPGLSEDTVAGLKAMAEHARATLKKEVAVEQPQTTKAEAKPEVKSDDKDRTPDDLRRKQVDEHLKELDDLEFDRVMRSIQNDVINNDTEKTAVKARVKPIDLTEGLATGEFTQDVPINSALTIRYRTVSPAENQSIRLLLFQWIDKDPRREALSAELYGLMLSVASIVRINTQELPSHLDGTSAYEKTFNEDVFTKKFSLISGYPMPLVHAIGVHGAWFDQRVRELFTSETLKNG